MLSPANWLRYLHKEFVLEGNSGEGMSMAMPEFNHRFADRMDGCGVEGAFVVLAQPGNMTVGALAMNSWSYAGDSDRADTNQFSLQYFFDYGLGGGWAVATSPLLTANWKSKGKKWLIPVGGGINKVIQGKVPVQVKFHAYYHAARPDSASVRDDRSGNRARSR